MAASFASQCPRLLNNFYNCYGVSSGRSKGGSTFQPDPIPLFFAHTLKPVTPLRTELEILNPPLSIFDELCGI